MSKPGFTRFLSIMMGPWLRYFTGLGFSSRTFPKFTDAEKLAFCIALDDVRWPRCNGYGRARIVGLSRYPSI